MPLIFLVPTLISVLVLAAHFLRTGPAILALFCLVVPAVLFIHRRWALRFVQMVLLLGAAEWVRTLTLLIQERQLQGQPWSRLAWILGTVAVFTAGSALILQAKRVQTRYTPLPDTAPPHA